ncbi:hypothetical protein [Flavobacterium sp.]|jgi:hypothetical protein|uniref:hypothetical protein n=1 Tax=Flavobacterium sp. TaxID=239 RepID=UPI0037C0FDAD
MTDENTTLFLLSWDCNGLESVISVTENEKQVMWAKLQDKPPPTLNGLYTALLLRARYNSQRHYEIYSIRVEDTITEQDIREQFAANPQGMAELIRERGNKLYSDRLDQKTTKIV